MDTNANYALVLSMEDICFSIIAIMLLCGRTSLTDEFGGTYDRIKLSRKKPWKDIETTLESLPSRVGVGVGVGPALMATQNWM